MNNKNILIILGVITVCIIFTFFVNRSVSKIIKPNIQNSYTPTSTNNSNKFTPSNSNDLISFNIFTPSPDMSPSITNLCSLNNALWYCPLQDVSSDPTCQCNSNEKRLNKKMNGIIYYKCQLNNQN